MPRSGSQDIREMGERSIVSLISRILGEPLDDDCAYIRSGRGHIALTVDAITQDRNLPAEALPGDVGWHAAAVSLSDLASSGAEPLGLLLSMVVPGERRSDIPAMMRGARSCASRHGTRILGGDTKQGGCLTLTSVGVGRVRVPVRRSGARPGDSVYMTGRLGRCVLALLQEDRARASRTLLRVHPRVDLAGLVRSHASACTDISDGLVSSMYSIAQASGCALQVDIERLPLARGLSRLTRGLTRRERSLLAANIGGDYELLFTSRDRIPPRYGGVAITRIGRVIRGDSVVDKAGVPLRDQGYEHFTSRWAGHGIHPHHAGH